jgi:hypothetical protein
MTKSFADIVRHSKKKWQVGSMIFKAKTEAQKYVEAGIRAAG